MSDETIYHEINERAAKTAHNANSFREFKEGQHTNEYRMKVDEALKIAEAQKECVHEQYHAKIDGLAKKYARMLAEWYNRHFEIEARVPSMMISGGGNFPTRKKEKQNAARKKHWELYNEIEGIRDRINSTGTGGVKSTDENPVERLQEKLESLRTEQKYAKALNTYYKKHGTCKGFEGLSDEKAALYDLNVENAYSWAKQPYPSYELSSINGKIKQAESRLQDLNPVTDLEIKLVLQIAYKGGTKAEDLTIENIGEHEIKLTEQTGEAFIKGKVYAGERHTAVSEWIYPPKNEHARDYNSKTIKQAITAGLRGGTVNKKIIFDCWDKHLNGNTYTERVTEKLMDAKAIGGGEIKFEENRINIYFDGKPDEDIRTKIKKAGFKWSPSRSVWTRQDTDNARYSVNAILAV